jgi:hypothetical protein
VSGFSPWLHGKRSLVGTPAGWQSVSKLARSRCRVRDWGWVYGSVVCGSVVSGSPESPASRVQPWPDEHEADQADERPGLARAAAWGGAARAASATSSRLVPAVPADGHRSRAMAPMIATHTLNERARKQQCVGRSAGLEPSRQGRDGQSMLSAFLISIAMVSVPRVAPFARAGSLEGSGGGRAG